MPQGTSWPQYFWMFEDSHTLRSVFCALDVFSQGCSSGVEDLGTKTPREDFSQAWGRGGLRDQREAAVFQTPPLSNILEASSNRPEPLTAR